jgi:hypothetical protein
MVYNCVYYCMCIYMLHTTYDIRLREEHLHAGAVLGLSLGRSGYGGYRPWGLGWYAYIRVTVCVLCVLY